MPAAVTEKPPRREVIAMLGEAVAAMDALLNDARRAVGDRVTVDGRVVSRRFDSEQRATHGLAWLATYVEGIKQMASYARRLSEAQRFGEIEALLTQIGHDLPDRLVFVQAVLVEIDIEADADTAQTTAGMGKNGGFGEIFEHRPFGVYPFIAMCRHH